MKTILNADIRLVAVTCPYIITNDLESIFVPAHDMTHMEGSVDINPLFLNPNTCWM